MKLRPIRIDLRVAFFYLLFGGLWILLSDRLLAAFITDTATLTKLQTYKGWAFVGFSALLIFSLLRRELALRKIAESESHASENRYGRLIENARDVIFTISKDGMITSLNPAFEIFTGWTRDQWIGRPFHELIADSDRELASDQFNRILNGENLRALRLRIHTRSDELMVVEMNISPQTRDDHVIGLLGIARDMTQEQKAVEALKVSELRFRSLIENSYDAILFGNVEGIITFMGPSTSQVLGYLPEEMLGRYGIDLVHPEEKDYLQRRFAYILRHPDKTVLAQCRIKHKDGSWRWVEIVLRNMLADPNVQAVVGNYRDVTERRQAESRLASHAEHMATLSQISQQIHTTLDLDQVYINIHQAVQRLMPCDTFLIALLDEANEEIEDVYLWDEGQRWESERQPIGQGLTDFIITSGKPLRVNEWDETHVRMTKSSLFGNRERDTRSVLAVPLFHSDGKCFGMISAQAYIPNAYTTEHEQLLITLTSQVSQAIENAKLFAALQQELTDRGKAEQALRDSEDLYRKAIEVAGAVPYYEIYYNHGELIQYNFIGDGIRKLTGYGPEEFTAELWDTLVIDSHLVEDLENYSFDEAVHRVRAGRNPIWKCEYRIRHRNGEVRWVFEAAVELRDEAGNAYGSIGMYQDITPRKQAEAELRESQQRLSLFFNQSLDGFFFSMLDEPIEWQTASESDKEKLVEYALAHQHVTEANDAMIAQYGSTRTDFIGRTGNDFFAHDPDQARNFRRNLFDTGHLHLETEERRDDGTPMWVEGDYVCMYDRQKRITGMFGIQRDVTLRKKTEEDIRQQNRFVSALAETIPGLVYVYDWETDSNVYSNRGIEAMLGYTSEEVQAMGTKLFSLLFNLDDAAAVVASQQRLLSASDQDVFEVDYRLRHSNGEWRWLRSYERPFARRKDGSISQKIGIAIDITARKQAEDVLQEAEEKYRNLVERLTQVIYTSELGDNGVWSYVSPQIEKLLGFTPQEWMSNPELWYQQVHPDDRDVQLVLEEQAFTRNEPFDSEYRILTRNGNWIWVRDTGYIFPQKDYGNPIVQGMLMDITERKQAEEALSLSKAQLLANLNNTPSVAVQWYDKDGHVLYWNPASEAMYGWDAIEAIGKTLDQLIHTPEEQAEFMRILAKVRETGAPFGPYEAQIRHKNNTTGWVLSTTFSIPMNDEQIGFVCMDVDITERKQAEEQIQKQLKRLNALHTIDMAINSSADIRITLEVFLNQMISQLNVDAANVLLFNQSSQDLELIAERGFRSNAALPPYQRLSDFYAGEVINKRSRVYIEKLMEAGKKFERTAKLASEAFTDYIGVPLIAKGQIKGVLEIYQRSSLNINEDWLNFLEVLASQAAIAIDNSQLLQGLQRSNMEIILAYDATIEGWSRAMDLRDKETEGHTQRVTTMTLKLARAMGIREADIIHIQRGALLHDIGKLGVPDNILLKEGGLTNTEWTAMRQHPALAYNMIKDIAYLKNATDIPYCHHEKWDGTGYPRGLKGEQIPLSARIFAVVDVWDALTSDRPYRKAWSNEQTLEFIQSQSDKHFDPQVVEAFLNMIAGEI